MLANTSATPLLKPTITVSEMKFTTAPARSRQASSASAETMPAVAAASAAWRAGSPSESSASDVPISSEIAEVTVTTVCCEEQKSQNTSPPKRHA